MKPQFPLVISTLAQRFAMGAYCFGLVAACLFGVDVNMSLLSIVSLVVLALGMSASSLHLGKPGRILNTFANPSSHLTKEVFCVPLVGIPYLLVGLNGYAYEMAPAVLGTFELIGFAASLLFIWVTAMAYLMPGRPAWRTPATPASFCLTFLSAGAVAADAFMAYTGAAVPMSYHALTLVLIVAAIVGQGLFILATSKTGFGAEVHPLTEAYRPFFIAWIVTGVILPLILECVLLFAPTAALSACVFVFYVASIFAWQCYFFMCGKDVMFFPEYPEGMNPEYF